MRLSLKAHEKLHFDLEIEVSVPEKFIINDQLVTRDNDLYIDFVAWVEKTIFDVERDQWDVNDETTNISINGEPL